MTSAAVHVLILVRLNVAETAPFHVAFGAPGVGQRSGGSTERTECVRQPYTTLPITMASSGRNFVNVRSRTPCWRPSAPCISLN